MGRTRDRIAPKATGKEDSAQSGSTTVNEARKKSRVAKPKASNTKKGKKLTPKRLLDLPPQAFKEITKYIMPADLLALARTNKLLRKMFMSRASHHLWKIVMENIPNMVPCPMELSEPQYISLLYSPTCSNCGNHVLQRRMDPWLLVRLCDSCLEEQADEWRGDEGALQFLPRTHMIKKPQSSSVFVLKRDIQDMNTAAQGDREGYVIWKNSRSKQVQERQNLGDKIKEFLNWIESGPNDGLEYTREERWEQIKTRLITEGWREEEFQLRYLHEWRELVWQPTPITDRNWAGLRSKLLPFLNKTYYMNADQKKRRQDRINKLQSFTRSIRNPLPPLVYVTLQLPHDESKPAPKYTAPRSDYQDVRINMPFPSTNEFLMWPMIRNIVGADISPEAAEASFKEIKDEVNQAVVEWRDKLERDLVETWSSRTNIGNETRAIVDQTMGGLDSNGYIDRTGSAALRTVGKAFPEFVITYGKPDGTTTTNLSDLSPSMRLLLRADTIFKGDHLHLYFPDIVPQPYLGYTLYGGTEEELYGERWDRNKFERDNEMSAMARDLLARVGRSGALAAEMQALGRNFTCGRCHRTMSDGWEDLVRHYTTEERQSKLAQTQIRDNPRSGFLYRNTHDLGPGNPKPFARFLTSSQAADIYEETMDYQMYTMSCIKCEGMGIPTRYFYTSSRNIDSPMLEHLRDVHDIQKGKMGVHFKPEPLPDDSDED